MICRFERVLRDYTPCDSRQGFSAQDQYPAGPPPILKPILHSVCRPCHPIQRWFNPFISLLNDVMTLYADTSRLTDASRLADTFRRSARWSLQQRAIRPLIFNASIH